jgi:NAD(P)-dependent dehydrogenase (short-subunit alcohol dehydrogenase family)
MLEHKHGRIVFVSSRTAYQSGAKSAAYAAAKATLLKLTESLSAEVKNEGINVNCVVPSTIDTPENRAAMSKADPAKWVTPESLAQVILFLCSPAAHDIHGAALPVYGRV